MNFRNNLLLIILILIISQESLTGQVITNYETELSSENFDFENELVENLIEPININKLITDPLLWTSLLNEQQYNELMDHIKNSGPVLDLLELQTLTYFNINDFNRLKEVIIINPIVNNRIEKDNLIVQEKVQYTSQKNTTYVGSNWSNYQRIKLDHGNWQMGISREFDVGENSSTTLLLNNYDHYNYYLSKSFGKHSISIGRYQIFHGIGIGLGQGFNRNRDITGNNTSTQNTWQNVGNSTENNLFSGAFYNFSNKEYSFKIGISSIKIDSGSSSGLHRTSLEINRRKKIEQNSLILSVSKCNRISNNSILLMLNDEKRNSLISICKDYRYRNYIGYAEIAIRNASYSYCIGINSLVNKKTQIGLSYYYRNTNYTSAWSSTNIQNFSNKQNVGLNFNLQLEFNKKINIVFYHRLSTKYNIYNREETSTSGLRSTISINKINTLNIINIKTWSNTVGEYNNINRIRTRINWNYDLSEQINQTLSLNGSGQKKMSSVGLAYQIQIKLRNIKFQYAYAQFDIQDNANIYFNLRSSVSAFQSIGVFESQTINSIGLSFKLLDKIQTSALMQIVSKNAELNNSYRFTLNIRYQ